MPDMNRAYGRSRTLILSIARKTRMSDHRRQRLAHHDHQRGRPARAASALAGWTMNNAPATLEEHHRAAR
jgi:hypothetical protein